MRQGEIQLMITENLLAKKVLGKTSKNKCMVGKHFQDLVLLLMNGERLLFGIVHA